ncbi:MAG: serine/threonine-protein kinase, partial [Myxococcota bacterium]
MAEVFLGRFKGPAGFERPVVVKRILPHLARQKNFVDMFRDEACIAARINHRNVVQVHELGEDEEELYLVMEYLGGESAAGIARQLARRKKLMSFGLCAHLIAEVCAGLHAAHELRDETGRPLHIVHRDVSPANIFITYEGSVKILDFGIAVAANRLSITDAGQVKGKYAYMSPEQCRGRKLDRRSDIFSIGTVLYELSTCRRLFKRASDMETLDAICSNGILPPSRLVNNYPPQLERICLKALQNDPDNRYATAAEMRSDLVELARTLNKDKLPDRALAKVMRRLFSDRIGQKQRMLKRLESGEDVRNTTLPSEEHSIELPVVPEAQVAALSASASMLVEPLSSIVPNEDGPPPALPGPVSNTNNDENETFVRVPPQRPQWATLALLVFPLLVGIFGGVWLVQRQSFPQMIATVQVAMLTVPEGAEVLRNGKPLGTTPLVLTLAESE